MHSQTQQISVQNWKGYSSQRFGPTIRVTYEKRDQINSISQLHQLPILGRRHFEQRYGNDIVTKPHIKIFEIKNKCSDYNDIQKLPFIPSQKRMNVKPLKIGRFDEQKSQSNKVLDKQNVQKEQRVTSEYKDLMDQLQYDQKMVEDLGNWEYLTVQNIIKNNSLTA